jgi:ankyrin repeat protein
MHSNRRTFLASAGLASLVRPSSAQQSAPPLATANDTADIFQAAFAGDLKRATELAKWNPALAHLRSPDGRTPLHYAVAGGHSDMITFLTLHGADLSAGPESPLLTAVDYPHPAIASEISRTLLMNASDPNAARRDGRTALDLATARGYRDIVSLLVHRGATGPQASGVTAERVSFAQRYGFDVEGRPWHADDLDGLPQDFINEFVRLAHGDGPRVRHLLKLAPALLKARATWDEMAIEAAAHMGLATLGLELADLGAPVSICTATVLGLRPRVEGLVQSDAACVRERGAHDIALIAFTALGPSRHEIADVLLRAGADVSAAALGGATTLHLAAGKGYVELADILLQHGADVNATVKDATPLAVALKSKQDKVANLLRAHGGKA